MSKRRKTGQEPTPAPEPEEVFSRTTAVQKFMGMHPAGTMAPWQPVDVIGWWMRRGVVARYTDEWVRAAYDAEKRGER